MNRLDLYTSIVPNENQIEIQRNNFNVFFHYGMNTFTGLEWGDGKEPPTTFNPTNQDTDQWCRIVKDLGASGIIITAKHHDGFCLWQTETTEYSIKNSPYKSGKGDVVRELSDSCKKHGLKLGIYLSPWDRNSEYYGTDKYNDFYCRQLTELLSNYGDIFCIWLDGACGSHLDGKPKQKYDFERYYSLVRKLQPKCILSNCAPDVRWVGNEGGYARESEWNVLPAFNVDTQKIQDESQQENVDGFKQNKPLDVMSEDLGSRKVLSNYNSFIWYPAEVDVSIRPGWFYHKNQDKKVRTLKNLMYIYYTSVGGNSLLLLNIPPDKTGQINIHDEKRLKEMGDSIKSAFSKPVDTSSINAPTCEENNEINNVLKDDFSYYTPKNELDNYTITLQFEKTANIDKVLLIENVNFSQRVENYAIYAINNGKKTLAYSGTTIGYKRIALFKKAHLCDGIEIDITSCRKKPYLERIAVYETDGFIPKPTAITKVKKYFRKLGTIIYTRIAMKKSQ